MNFTFFFKLDFKFKLKLIYSFRYDRFKNSEKTSGDEDEIEESPIKNKDAPTDKSEAVEA